MNTTPVFHASAPKDNIPAYEALYQQALKNDEQFHVLKDIRQAINKLKKDLEKAPGLSVEGLLPAK